MQSLDMFKTTVELLRDCQAPTVLDIGSNLGIFGFFAVREGYDCHAFEPHPYCFSEIKRRSVLYEVERTLKKPFGKSGHFQAWNLALYDTDGEKTLYHHCTKIGGHSIVKGKVEHEGGGSDPKTFTVEIRALDSWIAANYTEKSEGKIKLLKIDVESAEAEVLKGGISFLSTFKPHLIIEVRGGLSDVCRHTLADCIDILAPLGYNLYADETITSSGPGQCSFDEGRSSSFGHVDVLFSTDSNIRIDRCFDNLEALTRHDKVVRLFNRIGHFRLGDLTSMAVRANHDSLY